METVESIIQAELDLASRDEKYEYGTTSLGPNEIRILYLLPQNHDGEDGDIHCYLVRLDLGATKAMGYEIYPFMALSYVWGAVNPRKKIWVNGKSMEVNPGLFEVLTHIRKAMAPVPLWIDAICINQQDIEERSREVRNMKKIYEECQVVLYWLGVAETDARYVTINGELDGSVAMVFAEFGMVYDEKKHLVKDDFNLCLSTLLENPFWRRVWITQEFALAKDGFFMWGPYIFNMKIMEELPRIADSLFPQATDAVRGWNFNDYVHTLSTIRLRSKKIRFLEALITMRYRLASLKHDYIYATLGMADIDDLEPDYEKSYQEVSLEAFQVILSQEKNLDVLSACDRGWAKNSFHEGFSAFQAGIEQPDENWPTWLPDWSYKPFRGNDQLCDSTPCSSIFKITHMYLAQSLGQSAFGIGWQDEVDRQWHGTDDSMIRTAYHTLDSLKEAYKGVSLYGRHTSFTTYTREIEKTAGDDDHLQDSGSSSGNEESEISKEIRFRLETNDSTVFITRRGFLGRAPGSESTQEGDMVCIFLGAKVPFLLRKKNDTKYFEIVREAYVHGIMNEEAIKEMQEQEKYFILV
ncbi:HET-domain-containing protein [Annulohypoxylon nitens]|nr:HET-domain-containing protein [Annulohypoxylon nitens]